MKYSRAVVLLSVAMSLLAIAVVLYFAFYSGGSYLPAWIFTSLVALVLLRMLSLPRYVVLSSRAIEIHSTMELTVIKYQDIKSVKPLTNKDLKFCIPLLGVPGFLGYYGYYFNFKKFKIVSIYARQWRNFVEVRTQNNRCYVISVVGVEKFESELVEAIENSIN